MQRDKRNLRAMSRGHVLRIWGGCAASAVPCRHFRRDERNLISAVHGAVRQWVRVRSRLVFTISGAVWTRQLLPSGLEFCDSVSCGDIQQ